MQTINRSKFSAFYSIQIIACIILAAFDSKAQTSTSGLTGEFIGQSIAEMSNAIKEDKELKANQMTQVFNIMKAGIENIKKGNYSQAYSDANSAMYEAPKYSFLYFIMSYSALKLGDFITSQRMLRLYFKYENKKWNKENGLKAPKRLIAEIQSQVNRGLDSLTSSQVHDKFQKEPWKRSDLKIGLSAGIFSIDPTGVYNINNESYNSDSFPSNTLNIKATLEYNKYIWFNRTKASLDGGNSVGLVLKFGFTGDFYPVQFDGVAEPIGYNPTNFMFSFSPALILKRFYLSLFTLQYRFITGGGYTGSINSSTELGYPNVPQRFGVLFWPEVRYYVGRLRSYARDPLRKTSDETLSDHWNRYSSELGTYLYVEYQNNAYSGGSSINTNYNITENIFLAGIMFPTGSHGSGEFGLYVGGGSISNLGINNKGYSLVLQGGSTAKFGVSYKLRIL